MVHTKFFTRAFVIIALLSTNGLLTAAASRAAAAARSGAWRANVGALRARYARGVDTPNLSTVSREGLQASDQAARGLEERLPSRELMVVSQPQPWYRNPRYVGGIGLATVGGLTAATVYSAEQEQARERARQASWGKYFTRNYWTNK